MRKQLFGSVQTADQSLPLMVCRDADRPGEWMLHCSNPKTPEKHFAVLANAAELDGGLMLKPRLLFKPGKNGAMYLPNLTPEEAREMAGSSAVLTPDGEGFSGHWTDAQDAQRPLQMQPRAALRVDAEKLSTWPDFKDWASSVRQKWNAAIFRGHGSSEFPLQTTLHRAGMQRIDRYCSTVLRKFHGHVEAHFGHRFNLEDSADYGTVLGLAQHHGLPTPLLDWTDSPYIAAFFAFADALENRATRQATHVRVFALTNEFVERLSPDTVVLPVVPPYVAALELSGRLNQRLYAQRGRFVVTNVADMEQFVVGAEHEGGFRVLHAADVPTSCAEEALEDLQFMGLTAASMFPGLDGVARMLRHQMAFSRPDVPSASLDSSAEVADLADAEKAAYQTTAADESKQG